MALQSLLKGKKDSLLKKWFDQTAQSYPSQTTEFLKNNKGQFSNPVGYSLKKGLEGLLDALSGDFNDETLKNVLDSIIRIRAVQDFTPSESVYFVFLIKSIVAQELGTQVEGKELLEFNNKIDRIALIAFDVYMQCREDLFEVRVKEVEKRNFRLLQVANQLFELRGDAALSQCQEDSHTEKETR